MNVPLRHTQIRLDPLLAFELRAWARAELYAACVYDLHEAVDVLQADAVSTGLIDQLGQDRVQHIIADAFHSSCFASLGPEILREDHMAYSDTFEVACRGVMPNTSAIPALNNYAR
jgi:hypothetical protein